MVVAFNVPSCTCREMPQMSLEGLNWGEGGWVPLEQPCQFSGSGMVVEGRYVNLWFISPKSFPIDYPMSLRIFVSYHNRNLSTL